MRSVQRRARDVDPATPATPVPGLPGLPPAPADPTTAVARAGGGPARGPVSAQPRWRLLGRGESAVALMGLTLAMILVAALASAAWWSVSTQRDSLRQARREQVRSVSAVLARSAEPILAAGD